VEYVSLITTRGVHPDIFKAHCGVDQVKCQEMHLTASKGMILPTKRLFSTLKVLSDHEDEVDHMLQEMGVPHIQVSYERMYHSDTADEWKRILRFFGREQIATNLTLVEVQEAMTHADTSYPWHNVTLGNYEEVKNVLAGTEFERLLH